MSGRSIQSTPASEVWWWGSRSWLHRWTTPKRSGSPTNSAPTATTSAITENTREAGNPLPRAAIPWASSRRVNQSSSPSSPRGGPTGGGRDLWIVVSCLDSCHNLKAAAGSDAVSRHPAYDDAPMPLQIIDTWTQTSNVPASPAAIIGPDGEREIEARRCCVRRQSIRTCVLDKATCGNRNDDRGRGGGAGSRRAGGGVPRPVSRSSRVASDHAPTPVVARVRAARGRSAGSGRGRCRAGVPARDPQDLLKRGVLGAGRGDHAATGFDHASYVREAVFEPLGMDAFLALPEIESGRALDVREPGLAGSGAALFNSAQWRQRATAAGGAFATVDAYARFVRMLLCKRRAADGRRDVCRDDRGCLPRDYPEGSSRSRPGTMRTGRLAARCVVTSTRTGRARARRRVSLSHFGASGTLFFADPVAGVGLVCLANRSTYSGWIMRPGAWPDLCDAVIGDQELA